MGLILEKILLLIRLVSFGVLILIFIHRKLMKYRNDMSPEPRSHIKTLMRIGYDFNSAIADIIDNSITAKASKINISPSETSDPFLSLLTMALAWILKN